MPLYYGGSVALPKILNKSSKSSKNLYSHSECNGLIFTQRETCPEMGPVFVCAWITPAPAPAHPGTAWNKSAQISLILNVIIHGVCVCECARGKNTEHINDTNTYRHNYRLHARLSSFTLLVINQYCLTLVLFYSNNQPTSHMLLYIRIVWEWSKTFTKECTHSRCEVGLVD